MAGKLYYSMGEVTEMFDVEPSLIRYWCAQFSCLRPKRNAKGNRMFSPQDIERLKRIHHLLREKKMTIEGAQKAMRKSVIEAEKNDSDMALLEQLQTLRAMLVDMRESIGDGIPVDECVAEEAVVETPVAEEVVAELPAIEEVVAEPVVEVAEEVMAVESTSADKEIVEVAEQTEEVVEEQQEAEPQPEMATTVEPEVVAELPVETPAEVPATLLMDIPIEQPVETSAVETPAEPVQKKKRAPRRKLIGEEGVVERPLFPFYEQTLF